MKAYVYHGHGGPEVEALADVPRPEPGPGQLLVAVDAAGVNPADWKRRAGGMRTPDSPPEHFPLLFGREAAGLVAAVGTASAGKKDFVESLGVTHVDYGPGVANRIRAAAPQGIDGVYDQVGGQALEDVAPLLADRSKLVSAGDRVTPARLGGAFVARVRGQQTLDALAQLVATGVLNPYVTRTFLLDQAGDALRLVEEGHARGKVVIEVAG